MYFTGPGSFLGPGNPAGARGDAAGVPGTATGSSAPVGPVAPGMMGFPGLPAGFGPPGVPPPGGLGTLPPLPEIARDLGPSFGGPGPAGGLLPGGSLLGHGLTGLSGPYSMFPMGAAPMPPPALPRLFAQGGTIPVPGAEPPPPLANGGGAGGAVPVGAPLAVGLPEEPPPASGPAKRRRAKGKAASGGAGGAPKGGGGALSGGGAKVGGAKEGGAEAAPAPAPASPPAHTGGAGSVGGAQGTYVRSNLVKDNEVTKIVVPYSTGHLVCPFNCGRTFNHASQRIIHVRKAHTGERPFVCKFEGCSKAFYSSGDLRAHMRTHSGERPYTCHVCGKGFRTRNALKTHVKSLHTLERPFKCPEPGCGMTYMTKIDLERHMVRHQKQAQKEEAAGAKSLRKVPDPPDQLSARGAKAKAGGGKTAADAAAAAVAAAGNSGKEGGGTVRVAPAGRLVAVGSQAEVPARTLAYFVPNEKHKGLNVTDFVVVSRSRLAVLMGAKRKGGAGARGVARAAPGGKKRVRNGPGSEADLGSDSGRAGSGDPEGSAGGEDPGSGSGSGSRKRVRSGEGPASGGLPRKRSVDSVLKEAYDLEKPPVTFQTWKRALTDAQIAGFAAEASSE